MRVALNFPAPNIGRDKMIPELFRFVSRDWVRKTKKTNSSSSTRMTRERESRQLRISLRRATTICTCWVEVFGRLIERAGELRGWVSWVDRREVSSLAQGNSDRRDEEGAWSGIDETAVRDINEKVKLFYIHILILVRVASDSLQQNTSVATFPSSSFPTIRNNNLDTMIRR